MYQQQYDQRVRGALDCHEELEPQPGPKERKERRTVRSRALWGAVLQDRGIALAGRSWGTVHERSGRAGHVEDEASHEDLGRVPAGATTAGFRHATQGAGPASSVAIALRRSCSGRPCCAASGDPQAVPSAYPVRSALGVGVSQGFGLRARQIVGTTWAVTKVVDCPSG